MYMKMDYCFLWLIVHVHEPSDCKMHKDAYYAYYALEILCSNVHRSSYCTTAALLASNGEDSQPQKENRKWLALLPFTPQLDASAVGKEIYGRAPELRREGGDPTTALKWVRRCYPHLPVSLVQKLFRLRQVRREIETQDEHQRVKRVKSVILLPLSVQKISAEKKKSCSNSEDETDFIRSLVLYKDPAIIVINKPPGMPVQVHRLDRDSSRILVLARSQTSASVLHSIFREKTSEILVNDVKNTHRALQRKYWALVIGTPRCPKGLISAPLVKGSIRINGKALRGRQGLANILGMHENLKVLFEASSYHS